jgi:DNA-binding HxlR family transcriptional regulator
MTIPRLQDLPGRACSIAGALEVVGDRWALLVVREVSMGSHRFTDIARGTGAPRDRLTARLNDLVEVGVLERRPYSTTPPRSGYHLTRSGRDLLPVLHALLQWGDRWVAEEPPVRLHHSPAGSDDHPIELATVCRTCGEPVAGSPVRRVVNGTYAPGTSSDAQTYDEQHDAPERLPVT